MSIPIYPCPICQRGLSHHPRPELENIPVQMDCRYCGIHALGSDKEDALRHLQNYAERKKASEELSPEIKTWLAIAAGVDYETRCDHATGKITYTTAPCSVTMRNGIPHVQLPNRG